MSIPSSKLSTIQTKDKDIDIISLGKKIGRLEISTNHLNEQFKEECNNRMILEKKAEKMAEEFSSELSIVKTGFDSISLTFKEGIETMKKSIMEEVDFKTSSILHIVKSAALKVDQLEASENNTFNFEQYKTEVDKRFKKLEKNLSISIPNKDIEINTGLAKISFLEKKLNENIEQMNAKVNDLSKDITLLKKEIEIIKKTRNDSKERLEHFQRDFISTNSNNLKFNYQTTMLLNEAKEKIKSFEGVINKQTEELKQLKDELCTQFSETKTKVDCSINSFEEDIKKISKELVTNQDNFHDHIINQNEQFVSFIQDKIETYCSLINEKINKCENEFAVLSSEKNKQGEQMVILQKQFFNNLNEVEEFLTKKYDNLSKLINMK